MTTLICVLALCSGWQQQAVSSGLDSPRETRPKAARIRGTLGGGQFMDREAARDLRVTAFAVAGPERRRLRSTAVRRDGSWSISIPARSNEGELCLRLDGRGCVPWEIPLVWPEPGQVIEVAAEYQRALQVCVLVLDWEGQPLSGARVDLRWQAGPAALQLIQTTDANGRAHITEAPPAEVWLTVAAQGHATRGIGPLLVPELEEQQLPVKLERAGKVSGRCVQRGLGVPDFHVYTWDERLSDVNRVDIANSADGRFLLSDVPTGPLWLIATSPIHPPSRLYCLAVPERAPAEIEIELPAPASARAQVLAAGTLRPTLEEGSVQVFACAGGRALAPWGEVQRWPVGANHVELELSPFDNLLLFRSGKGSAILRVSSLTTDGCTELAAVQLQHAGRLRLQCVGGGTPGIADCRMECEQLSGKCIVLNAGEAGGAEVALLDGGPVVASVYLPKSQRRLDYSLPERASAGGDWGLPMVPGRMLEIILPAASVRPGGAPWHLRASYRTEAGLATRHNCRISAAGGRANLEWVEGELVVIELFDEHYRLLTTDALHWNGLALQQHAIDLPADPHRLRFLDLQGEPIRGRAVCLRLCAAPAIWERLCFTDATGEVPLDGLTGNHLLVEMEDLECGLPAFWCLELGHGGVHELTLAAALASPQRCRTARLTRAARAAPCNLAGDSTLPVEPHDTAR